MFGVETSPGILTRLERTILRAIVATTSVVVTAYALIGLVSGDTSYLLHTIGVALVGGLAAAQAYTGRGRIWHVLTAAAVAIVAQTALFGRLGGAASSAPDIALIIIGMTASVFVARRLVWYLVAYGGFIVAAHLVWRWSEVDAGLAEGLLGVTMFVFGSVVVTWMRNELGKSATQYRWLFDATPVTIRIEDFTRVGTWLDDLRKKGVTDLRAWLEADPERVLEGVRRVEVVDVNAAGIAMLEADGLVDLQGSIPASGVTDESRSAFVEQFAAIWNDVDHLTIEVPGGRTLTNKHLDLLLYWNAPRVAGRLDLSRVTVALVDVTDLRQTERNLTDLLRSKDEFVATISHELRTPLTAVVGLSEELRDVAPTLSPDETRDLLALLAAEAVEVSSIVEDLLTAARADSDAVSVLAEDVDLADEVAVVLRTLGDRPVFTDATAPAVARADSSRVRQILRNLLVNAQRYGGERITIRISATDDAVAVAVCDNGSPLPDHQRQAIFDRYYRAEQRPGLTASVGLGLAVSRELARLMHGDLSYHHDGSETVFTLTLPAADAGFGSQDPDVHHRVAG